MFHWNILQKFHQSETQTISDKKKTVTYQIINVLTIFKDKKFHCTTFVNFINYTLQKKMT